MVLGVKAPSLKEDGSGLFLTALCFWGLAACRNRFQAVTGNSIVFRQVNLCFRYLGAAYFPKWSSEDASFAQGLWGLGNLDFAQSEHSRAGCP